MHPLEEQLSHACDALGVRGGRLLVAVSGGADSTALLHALAAVHAGLDLDLHVAHLNHQLRPEADADADWVANAAERLGIPVTMEVQAVAAARAGTAAGIEETARSLRYAFLAKLARSTQSSWVAVAHTADDQVETILHHIVRGTGLEGLRGIRSARPLGEGLQLVRPLLGVRRAELRGYLSSRGLDWRHDHTNDDVDFTRNRIRHELLPLLRADFNDRVDEALLRLGRQAGEAQDVVAPAARRLLSACVEDPAATPVRFDCGPLADAPRHLVREVLRTLWQDRGWRVGAMTFDHWDRLAALVAAATGSAVFPGSVHAERRGRLLVLRPEM